ncbi:MAG: hypothetical protein ABIJ31_09890 [Pseudomonadota bacterium]
MSNYNFQIELECPQCGAPVVLDETECIIQCNFCRTRHILQSYPYPCYYIEPGQDNKYAKLQVTYIPYWRFKGLEFTLGGPQSNFRIIDHSYLAVDKNGVPPSLGLRSQTQKLKFIKKKITGSFLPPGITRKDILRQIAGKADQKAHIGEILSLIFMPFYQDTDSVYDGLSGEKIDLHPSELLADKQSPAIHLDFTPALCPNCGWDLKGETDSLVLSCNNCMRFWLVHKKKLNNITPLFYGLGPKTDMLLPFWRFQIESKVLDCSTHAHLITMANLSKVIRKTDETHPLYFYIPAFKINPKLFLRIGRQTTLAQIEPAKTSRLPATDLYPVNLSLEEGFQAVVPLLLDLCTHKEETWNLLKNEKPEAKSFCLIYLSFRAAGNELIQDNLGVALPANSLRFGRNL